MHIRKRFISIAAVVFCTAVAVFYGTGTVKAPQKPSAPRDTQTGFLPSHGKETIYLWYTDNNMTSFLNSAAVAYGEEEGVRVIPVLTAEGEYLEAINQASLHTEQIPDIYLLDNDSLEKAYLAGLASETRDEGTICNEEIFPKAALHATRYQGKNIAYPFYFETTCLLYNATYLDQWIAQQDAREEEWAAEHPGSQQPSQAGNQQEGQAFEQAGSQQDSQEASGEAQSDDGIVPSDVRENAEQGIFGTLDDLLAVANTFDVPEGIEGIMKWDVTDIFDNYWFVGKYLAVGGEDGDDRTQVEIANEETVLCLKTYQLLNQFFSMETKRPSGAAGSNGMAGSSGAAGSNGAKASGSAGSSNGATGATGSDGTKGSEGAEGDERADGMSYDPVLQDFIDGKIMFTVATTDAIARMESAKEDGSFAYEYGVAMMPDVSEALESASLSVTDCVVINGYSEHKALANDFAAYLVCERVEDLYEKTGKLAAKWDTDKDNGPAQIFKLEYADSVSLPKMMETGNFWLQMEVLFAKVWDGEDVETLVKVLDQQISTQIAGE